MHAALWLVLVLAGAAAQFLLLAAEFVALTQVLVYIGAIVVLFLFGIMLTKAEIGGDADLTRRNGGRESRASCCWPCSPSPCSTPSTRTGSRPTAVTGRADS